MIRPIELSEVDVARFWSKVNKRGPDKCWEWTDGCDKNGYGYFQLNGSSYRAHRVAFAVTKGDTDLWVCHHCDNPPCCNPTHLYAGTAKDDARDRDERGRTACGENSGHTKLTESDVREIRRLRTGGWLQREIAKEYGISRPQVSAICNRKNWKHISNEDNNAM